MTRGFLFAIGVGSLALALAIGRFDPGSGSMARNLGIFLSIAGFLFAAGWTVLSSFFKGLRPLLTAFSLGGAATSLLVLSTALEHAPPPVGVGAIVGVAMLSIVGVVSIARSQLAAAVLSQIGTPSWSAARGWRASGTVRGFAAEAANDDSTLTISVRSVPQDLELSPERMLSFATDLQTGDAEFDRAVRLQGPLIQLLTILDPPARAVVSAAIAAGIRVKGGAVYWIGSPGTDPALATLLDVASILSRKATPAALLSRLGSELDARVRARMLAPLASTSLAEEALRAGLRDDDHAVRARAAELVNTWTGAPPGLRAEAAQVASALEGGALSLSASDEAGRLSTPVAPGALSTTKKTTT